MSKIIHGPWELFNITTVITYWLHFSIQNHRILIVKSHIMWQANLYILEFSNLEFPRFSYYLVQLPYLHIRCYWWLAQLRPVSSCTTFLFVVCDIMYQRGQKFTEKSRKDNCRQRVPLFTWHEVCGKRCNKRSLFGKANVALLTLFFLLTYNEFYPDHPN